MHANANILHSSLEKNKVLFIHVGKLFCTSQIEYKEYTLKDYRKMKKEVRLGGLGPDLDNEDVKEKVQTIHYNT